jgi:uncharacterized protein YbaA (DUF1428 family)
MVLVPGEITDVMNAHIKQAVLVGALQNTTVEISWENFREQRENVKLHKSILADSRMSDKRGAGIDASLERMVR